MTKVVIDSFDNDEQAVAFVHWLKRHSDNMKIKLLTIEGLMDVQWDGVDLFSSTKEQLVVNIIVDSASEEDF